MILAIDPSLTGTAVIRGDGKCYAVHCFGSDPNTQSVYRRINRFRGLVDDIARWIGENEVTAIFIEGYSFGSNQAMAKSLAEFGGLLRDRLLYYTSDIYEIPPSSLKRFATGNGAAKKPLVCKCLRESYNVHFKTDDEYDAFGLYRLGLCVLGYAEPQTRAQTEVVEQIRNPQPKARKPRKPGMRKKKENTLFS